MTTDRPTTHRAGLLALADQLERDGLTAGPGDERNRLTRELAGARSLLRQISAGVCCEEPPHPMRTDLPIDEREIPGCGECLPCRAWAEGQR